MFLENYLITINYEKDKNKKIINILNLENKLVIKFN